MESGRGEGEGLGGRGRAGVGDPLGGVVSDPCSGAEGGARADEFAGGGIGGEDGDTVEVFTEADWDRWGDEDCFGLDAAGRGCGDGEQRRQQ